VHHVLRHKFTDIDFHFMRPFFADVPRMGRKAAPVDLISGLGPVLDELGLYLAGTLGHEVHFVEPVPKFIANAKLELKKKPDALRGRMVFHNNALGKEPGIKASGTYDGESWSVDVTSVGQVLKGRDVFAVSLDIHGFEPAAVDGLGDVLPDILFIEIIRSYDLPVIERMLRHLDDRGYALMDFMGYGPREGSSDNFPGGDIRDVQSAPHLCSRRSTGIGEWYRIIKNPEPHFKTWISTDIFAIKRSVLTQDMLHVLASVVCEQRVNKHSLKVLTIEDFKHFKFGRVSRCRDPTGLMQKAGLANKDNFVNLLGEMVAPP
jgi:hypothetical protein